MLAFVRRSMLSRLAGVRENSPCHQGERSPLPLFVTQNGSMSLLLSEKGKGEASGDVPLTAKKLAEN